MGLKHFVITPADRQAPLKVAGTKVFVLAPGNMATDQRVTLQTGSEGTGPPPHSHDWDESFYVCGGEIIFNCGGETTTCVTGTFVHVPAGTVHSFSYGPNGGEMIEITGGTSNAIEMFAAMDREVSSGPPDREKAIRVLEEHGVRVHV